VGALSNFLPVDEDDFFGVISGKVPEKYFEVNRRAFSDGRRLVEKVLMNA
jgi:hypothetical protein